MARMIATWLAMLCEVRRGARDQVAAMAANCAASPTKVRWPRAKVRASGFRVWCTHGRASPVEGHALIDRAYRHSAQVSMLHGASEVLGYSTEALILAGDWVRAAQHVDEALQLATRLHEHRYRPQLLLLKRRIALAQGAQKDADDASPAGPARGMVSAVAVA